MTPRIDWLTSTVALALAAWFLGWPNLAGANEVEVVKARLRCTPERICSVQATLRHADEGWDHYADRFEVLAPDGEVLATRVLRHPHVDEQPFTRGLRAVRIPAGLTSIRIRAHDSVHGYGADEFEIRLEREPADP